MHSATLVCSWCDANLHDFRRQWWALSKNTSREQRVIRVHFLNFFSNVTIADNTLPTKREVELVTIGGGVVLKYCNKWRHYLFLSSFRHHRNNNAFCANKHGKRDYWERENVSSGEQILQEEGIGCMTATTPDAGNPTPLFLYFKLLDVCACATRRTVTGGVALFMFSGINNNVHEKTTEWPKLGGGGCGDASHGIAILPIFFRIFRILLWRLPISPWYYIDAVTVQVNR